MWGNVDLLNIYWFLQMDANTFETTLLLDLPVVVAMSQSKTQLQLWILLATTAHTPTQVTFRKCNKEPSCVWEHFIKVEECDLNDPKADCKYCNRLYNCHPKRNGTSSVWAHINLGCKNYPFRNEKG